MQKPMITTRTLQVGVERLGEEALVKYVGWSVDYRLNFASLKANRSIPRYHGDPWPLMIDHHAEARRKEMKVLLKGI